MVNVLRFKYLDLLSIIHRYISQTESLKNVYATLNLTFSDFHNSRNVSFEPLPPFLTEIPLDEEDGLRASAGYGRPGNVITMEPYATSHLEVTTASNEILFPQDMFERYKIMCNIK